jgi:type II secretory pathway component PulJ
MTAMLLVGIAIAVLLYIVVQRLDRIIALSLQQQDHLRRIIGLLELPHQQAVDREREKADAGLEKAIADFGNAREEADPLLKKAIADFKNALDNADPERVAEMGRELRERGML